MGLIIELRFLENRIYIYIYILSQTTLRGKKNKIAPLPHSMGRGIALFNAFALQLETRSWGF